MMTPQVVKVTERNQLDARGNLSKVLAITYTVGPHGPFTLVTTPADLASGVAGNQLNQFAATLQTLPGAAS